MTENVTGYLATIAFGAATGSSLPAFGSDTYTELEDVSKIKIPAGSRPVEERQVLKQKSPKKFIGPISYSEASATGLRAFGDPGQNQMQDDANNGVPQRRNFRIVLPDLGNETHYFAGYCAKFEYDEVESQTAQGIQLQFIVDGDVTIVR
jgi:hypothetical protein